MAFYHTGATGACVVMGPGAALRKSLAPIGSPPTFIALASASWPSITGTSVRAAAHLDR